MLWLTVLILLLLAAVLLYPRTKIPRDASREGANTRESIEAYNSIGNWPIFKFERKIVMDALKRTDIDGFVIDVGCGPGYLAAKIARGFLHSRITGLDISDTALNGAYRNWPVEDFQNLGFIAGDVQELPLADNSVDFIVSSLSMHHWRDAKQAFNEIERVLKPGGGFLIMDLRRDSRRIYYYMLMIGQLFSPRAIRQTNGAVGSFWSSYTSEELSLILSERFADRYSIKRQSGWMLVSGFKDKKTDNDK